MIGLWKRFLIYGSFVTMFIVTAIRLEGNQELTVVSMFSLLFFVILSLLYENNNND